MENKYKFNSGTELNAEFDINLYETNFRSLDPQLGRFWQLDPLGELVHENSPYIFASNNPLLFNDPTGLQDSLPRGETSTKEKPKTIEEVSVNPDKKLDKILTLSGWLGLGADYYKELIYKGDWMYQTSKGNIQSIFNTKWGANKNPKNLGNVSNYSKNAQGAIRATKVVKIIKVGGKFLILVNFANDMKDVYNAWSNDDPDATGTYIKAGVNTAMTGVGFIPGLGWMVSGMYFAVDATIGWPEAIKSYIEVEKNKADMRRLGIMTFSDFKY